MAPTGGAIPKSPRGMPARAPRAGAGARARNGLEEEEEEGEGEEEEERDNAEKRK